MNECADVELWDDCMNECKKGAGQCEADKLYIMHCFECLEFNSEISYGQLLDMVCRNNCKKKLIKTKNIGF